MDNEKIYALMKKILLQSVSVERSVECNMFTIGSIMSENDCFTDEGDKSDTVGMISDMRVLLERNSTICETFSFVLSGRKLPEQVFECSDFIGEFAENCKDILSDKVVINVAESEKMWISSNRRILEYAFLSFLRKAVSRRIKHINLSCEKKDKKITIKMLAKGNVLKSNDPLDSSENMNSFYIDIFKEILPYVTDAECIVRDFEFIVTIPEKEIEGNINFRESPKLYFGDKFSPFSTMLSDISDYRFFK